MSSPTLALEPAAAAYESLKDELAAIPATAIMRVNVDVSRAASRALRVAPLIRELVPQMAVHAPTLPLDRVLRLETYALAAWYAHACTWSVKRLSVTKELAARARPLRAKLLTAAQLFVQAGFLDANKVADIRAGQGRLDIAKDMIALAALLEAAWPQVGTSTIITRDDLTRASVAGSELLNAIAHGERELAEKRASMGEGCARAYTLLWTAYDVARRAVCFLRWEQGDAHVIAPSLSDNRGGKRKRGRPVDVSVAAGGDAEADDADAEGVEEAHADGDAEANAAAGGDASDAEMQSAAVPPTSSKPRKSPLAVSH